MQWFQSYWIVAAIAACLLAVAVAMSWRRQLRQEVSEKRLTELETKFGVLTDRVTPISAAFRSVLIRELTHNHTPEMDELLAKLEPTNILSPEQEERLFQLLRERVVEFDDPIITDSERDAAAMLPMVMKRAKIETDAELVAVRAVSIKK